MSESNKYLYAALAAGELDAVIDDSPIAEYFSHVVPGLQFAGVLKGTEGAYAIMVRKRNNKLREEINRALGDMEKDGTLQRLRFKWFGDSYPGEQVTPAVLKLQLSNLGTIEISR